MPVYEAGEVARFVCPFEAPAQGLTVVDLSRQWAPRMFAEEDPYRAEYVALANDRRETGDGEPVDYEPYLAVFGIFPTPSLLRERMTDAERRECHDDAGDDPLAVETVQAHLRCDGLLPEGYETEEMDGPTREALYAFQRRNFILARGRFNEVTSEALAADSLELDFRGLLRTLRERVVDATGLLADGSASGGSEPILSRQLDPVAMRDDALEPLLGGEPDRVARATEAVARALGWTDPEAARDALAAIPPETLDGMRVAVRLPPPPAYAQERVPVRIEIDRGDVSYALPWTEGGEPIPTARERFPTFVLYAGEGEAERALVRWRTTIGGWRREVADDGEVGYRYKESPVGRRIVRELVVAPAWLPPGSTPDDELMRELPDGRWVANERLTGRGWGSAFGLVMLVHHDQAGEQLVDQGIRTHGTAAYESVLDGHSHGCHRLWNHLATRLGGFLLAHRPHTSEGLEEVAYGRELAHGEHRDRLVIRSRGWRYVLDPPVPLRVLEGRIKGPLAEPPPELIEPPGP